MKKVFTRQKEVLADIADGCRLKFVSPQQITQIEQIEDIICDICGFNLRILRETFFSKLNPYDPLEQKRT